MKPLHRRIVQRKIAEAREAKALRKQEEAAQAIEKAVSDVLAEGYLTGDLMASGTAKHEVQSTSDFGTLVTAKLA